MSNPSPRATSNGIVIALILIFLGIVSVGSDLFPGIILAGLGAWLLFKQMDGNTELADLYRRRRPQRTGSPSIDEEFGPELPEPGDELRKSGAEKVYAHALRAAERAGLNPDQMRVLPVDLGFMVFRADQDPEVFRTQPLPDEADYIQPFVQLRLPTRAVGRIKFEIVESDGRTVFVHEDIHELERGRNLITPTARLPIHDAHPMHRDWQLRVSADGLPLAVLGFSWEESGSRLIRKHITADGEISNELRATLAENRLGKLSLDELLDAQQDEEPKRRSRQ